jgi:hypothetical protein
MTTISTCPRCLRLVTLPEGHGPDDPMRCPLCLAEYPLSEALASVPPTLIPVLGLLGTRDENSPLFHVNENEAVPYSASEEPGATESETTSDFLAGLARTSEPAATGPATFNAAHFTPLITEPPVESGKTSLLEQRRRRKTKSAKRIVLEVIIGGLLGLLIPYYALWWIRGESCGLPRISWLPFLPPPVHSTDNSAP